MSNAYVATWRRVFRPENGHVSRDHHGACMQYMMIVHSIRVLLILKLLAFEKTAPCREARSLLTSHLPGQS